MKKKWISAILCAALVAGTLGGCGGKESGGSGNTSSAASGSGTSAPSEASGTSEAETEGKSSDTAQADGETVVLKIATILTTGEPAVNQMEAFAERVNERSGGSLEVQVYANSELYSNAQDIMEAIVRGGNVIAFADPAQMADYVPDYAIMNYPYIYSSPDDIKKVGLSSWGQEQVEAAAAKGIRVLDSMTTYFGTRQVVSKKSFTTPEEMKGIKCRVPTTPLWVSTLTAMGSSPTTIAFSEVYSALQQGVCDAAENPLPSIYAAKLQEVCDYIVMTGHMIAPGGLEMSEEVFQSLTEDQKTILTEEALAFADGTKEEVLAAEEETLQKMKDEGKTIVEVDKEAFAKACENIYQEYDEWTDGAFERVKNIAAGTEE